MSAFHFRLDRVLRLRRQAETEQARELGAALRREEDARAARDTAERVLQTGHQAITDPALLSKPLPAGILGSLRQVTSTLAHSLDHAEQRHEATSADVESERQDFEEARRERRVLERLREHAVDDWSRALARQDQKTTDAIAEQRWRLREDG